MRGVLHSLLCHVNSLHVLPKGGRLPLARKASRHGPGRSQGDGRHEPPCRPHKGRGRDATAAAVRGTLALCTQENKRELRTYLRDRASSRSWV